ncbi:MAG: 4a-hydroxytetrahydrobiopterin dehydratase [Ignavibacteriaceae bacterium]|nr:4a-hydroxytetrahydrobiopterin dehydratase [Ignavibacteriaceae bacterium]
MLLSSPEINVKLNKLSGWKLNNQSIEKEYILKDFKLVLAFVNKVGDTANSLDHHPDIFIHSWNKVKFTISTHSEGGLTDKDFNLAEKIEHLSQQ